eukprot:TRINITY_DN76648_c0_g1_i1.p1 TRINITY_DN76648_c0_g1~~TRINITY_DN76648_c0_g1_i1.p1  ORF type:complete len:240 (+),score=14.90 TRINITY_DN76648_c0_g1_i1:21-740(+)
MAWNVRHRMCFVYLIIMCVNYEPITSLAMSLTTESRVGPFLVTIWLTSLFRPIFIYSFATRSSWHQRRCVRVVAVLLLCLSCVLTLVSICMIELSVTARVTWTIYVVFNGCCGGCILFILQGNVMSEQHVGEVHGDDFVWTDVDEDGPGEQKCSQCSICLEDFENGDLLKKLSCPHAFHSSCLTRWAKHAGSRTSLCPMRCKLTRMPCPPPSTMGVEDHASFGIAPFTLTTSQVRQAWA